jgi:ketosteroid isomerase-like protein
VTTLSEGLLQALNARDPDGLASLFAADYRSEQPAHPGRGFGGAAQVRKNWSAVFTNVPDFRAELVRLAVDGATEWAEWDWSGTRTDGTEFRERGVTILGIRDQRVAWARLYVELIEEESDIEAMVDQETHREPDA